MLGKRILTMLGLLAVGLPALIFGGIAYFLLIAVFLCMAAWELVGLFQAVDVRPSRFLSVAGVLLLLVFRQWLPEWSGALLTGLTLLAMTWHLIEFERGRDRAATDFATGLAALVYLGWVGGYLLDLRNLENGLYWLLLVLIPVWMADSFAYLIGSRFGRSRLSPRLSPKKTWEGYWAGVAFGVLGGVLFAWLWTRYAGLEVALWQGALIGLVLALLTTLGDLGESMFKRQAGIKDSSSIFPGHGGFLDRIDSWLWAAPLGYYLILWLLF